MKLSEQFIAVLMVTLQNSLMTQSDIVPPMKAWEIEDTENGLVITNPPTKIGVEDVDDQDEDEEY